MNTQTALKRCFDYFVDMNHKPGYRNGNCVYYANGSNPVRCAIGCLIPERFQEEAGRVMGGLDSLLDEIPNLAGVFMGVNKEVLKDMQNQHDEWANSHSLDQSTREDFLDHLQTLMCFHEGD